MLYCYLPSVSVLYLRALQEKTNNENRRHGNYSYPYTYAATAAVRRVAFKAAGRAAMEAIQGK